MTNPTIITKDAPAPIGPYSQAVLAGSKRALLYTSGQIPIDPATGNIVEGGIKEQTRQVLKNVDAIIAAGGCTKEQIVKTTVFIKDMNTFAEMNEVYAEYFGDNKPARSTVEVARLPKDVMVEIEVIAAV